MKRLFLGKWWHWIMLLIAVGLLWMAGSSKMHVIYFNSFIMLLLTGGAGLLALLIWSTAIGEQVTRERLAESEESQPSSAD